MSSRIETLLDTPPTTADEPELFCPHCDYNLKGLSKEVCPECGHPFDRRRLIQWATEIGLLPGFERSRTVEPHGSWILRTCLFAPARLGRELPPFVDREAVVHYGRSMRILAILALVAVVVMLAPADGGVFFVFALVFSPAIIIASLACEAALALWFARRVRPRSVPSYHAQAFWRELCRCFSCHLVFSCGGVPVLFAILEAVHLAFPISLVMACALPIGWWSVCLGRAVAERAEPGSRTAAALFLIPIVGLASVGLASLMTAIEAMVLGLFCVSLH